MYRTWILAADGSLARVYRYRGAHNAPVLVDGGDFSHTNKPNRELVTDKRGRVFHSADGSRSAMAWPSDPHEQEKRVFAKELSHFLRTNANEFDRLFVVAPPKMLGYLRQNLPSRVKKKVEGELDKDIVDVTPELLGKRLQRDLNINSTLRP